MKKKTWVIAGVLILACLVLMAGCGGSGGGKTVTTTTTKEVSEASLGVPIYPGAAVNEEAAGSMRPGGPDAPGSSAGGPPPNAGGPPPGAMSSSSGNPPPPSSAGGEYQRESDSSGGPRPEGTVLWTADSIGSVEAWYLEKLSSKTDFKETVMPSMGGATGSAAGKVYTFKSGDATKMVMVGAATGGKGGTAIMIGEGPAGMPGAPAGSNSGN